MGGASALAMAGVVAERPVSGSGPVWSVKKHGLCAEHLRSRTQVSSETGRRRSQSAFQVTFMSELRPPETGILSEKPRPATPTVGTAGQGRVMIRPLVEDLIARFGERAECIAEA
jgi:hypothetical protein